MVKINYATKNHLSIFLPRQFCEHMANKLNKKNYTKKVFHMLYTKRKTRINIKIQHVKSVDYLATKDYAV